MKFVFSKWALIVATTVLSLGSAVASEAAIRKNLSERLPNLPKIDEVSKTPMNGLFEIRMGNEVMYSDADGSFLIQGALIDVKQKRNLTEERMPRQGPAVTAVPSQLSTTPSAAAPSAQLERVRRRHAFNYRNRCCCSE